MKQCPFCAEMIQDQAVKCRFCGEFLTDDSREAILGLPAEQSATEGDHPPATGPRPPAPPAGSARSGAMPIQRARSTMMIIFALLGFGPFALPLVWTHPRYSRFTKVLVTVLVLALTVLVVFLLIWAVQRIMGAWNLDFIDELE